MSWSTPKSVILTVVTLLATSACTSPDLADSQSSTTSLIPTTISTTAMATEATLLEPDPVTAQVTASTMPTEPDVLQPSQARRIAAEFVNQLIAAELSDDYELVSHMWSGYPQGLSGDIAKLQELVQRNLWLTRNQVRFDVVRSWSFTPETAMLVVSVTDVDWGGTFTLLLNHNGLIERVQFGDPAVHPFEVKGNRIMFGGIPTEGGAIAYVSNQLLDPEFVVVDYEHLTTMVELPAYLPGYFPIDLVTVSMATPEFPSAGSFLIIRDEATRPARSGCGSVLSINKDFTDEGGSSYAELISVNADGSLTYQTGSLPIQATPEQAPTEEFIGFVPDASAPQTSLVRADSPLWLVSLSTTGSADLDSADFGDLASYLDTEPAVSYFRLRFEQGVIVDICEQYVP